MFSHKEWFRSIPRPLEWCLMRIYFKVSWCCCRQHRGSHKMRKMKNTKERKPLWGQGEGDGLASCVPHHVHTHTHRHTHTRLILPLTCETSREGRVLELPSDPALSLPSPGTSMCLQKEWKLGRLGARSAVKGRARSGAAPVLLRGNDTKEVTEPGERAGFSLEPPAPSLTAEQGWAPWSGQSAPQPSSGD